MAALKKLLAFAFLAAFACAESPKMASTAELATIELVLGFNPQFIVAAPDLATAKLEAIQMASLDPVCGAVPYVCEVRAAETVFFGIFSDGSLRLLL